jgi:hypothetical protein
MQLAQVIEFQQPAHLKPDPFTDLPARPTRAQLVEALTVAKRWYDKAEDRKIRAELSASVRLLKPGRFLTAQDSFWVGSWRDLTRILSETVDALRDALAEYDMDRHDERHGEHDDDRGEQVWS